MTTTERVTMTVTLPIELVEGIDRFDRNRSRFIKVDLSSGTPVRWVDRSGWIERS